MSDLSGWALMVAIAVAARLLSHRADLHDPVHELDGIPPLMRRHDPEEEGADGAG